MTETLHTVVGGNNVFRDIGKAQALLIRGDLAIQIRKMIVQLGITHTEAAKRARITQPRLNDLFENRTHKFTLDTLVNIAAQLGYSVKLSLKKVG